MSKHLNLELASLRLRLDERAETLRQELRLDQAKLADDVREPNVVLDRKDQADLVTRAGVDDFQLGRDLAELTQVETALRRMDAGSYGSCEDCAKPIAPARLAAQPWASRCISCQTRYEKQAPRSTT